MAPKVFCTGTTGYIGGDGLHVMVNAHPDWEFTCLVRNSSKGAKVASQYPSIRLVYGDLDSIDLITEEASRADIIYHFANCDHEASAHAIAAGVSRSGKQQFWIHTSGTLILGWETMSKGDKNYGELLLKVYNDWDGIGELVDMPDEAAHRVVDKIVLASSARTAIVCPPTIYGKGRGPDNQRSAQAYEGAKYILQRKRGFVPLQGKNIWHQIHVHDLSDLYLRLGEAAAEGGGKATWNQEGYYLAENGPFVWGDIFREMTKIAYKKGLIPSDEAPNVSLTELKGISKFGHWIWATNSRGQALRGRKLLGWEPSARPLIDELPDVVEGEAMAMGLIQGHADRVAT